MASTVGDSRFIEFWVKKQSSHCTLAAGRRAEHTDTRNIVPRVFRGNRSMPENAIFKSSILQILPRNIVKGPEAIICSHAVNLHDDETKLRQRLGPRSKCLGDK